jgi:hypothetical protein
MVEVRVTRPEHPEMEFLAVRLGRVVTVLCAHRGRLWEETLYAESPESAVEWLEEMCSIVGENVIEALAEEATE